MGQEYTAAKLEVSGPSGNFAWSLPAGSSMPKDLQLAPEGKITGKPSTTGTFTFKAVVSDQAAKQSRSSPSRSIREWFVSLRNATEIKKVPL